MTIFEAKQEIKADLRAGKYLTNIDYLKGVGLSWTGDDVRCIVVRIDPNTPASERDRIPGSFNGYTVLVEEQEAQILGTAPRRTKATGLS